MENNEFDKIAYKKAQRRVREISNYYWYLGGYIIVAVLLLYRNNENNMFNFKREHTIFLLILQGIFLLGYGAYLFIPAFHSWEERKTKRLMDKYKKNGQ